MIFVGAAIKKWGEKTQVYQLNIHISGISGNLAFSRVLFNSCRNLFVMDRPLFGARWMRSMSASRPYKDPIISCICEGGLMLHAKEGDAQMFQYMGFVEAHIWISANVDSNLKLLPYSQRGIEHSITAAW